METHLLRRHHRPRTALTDASPRPPRETAEPRDSGDGHPITRTARHHRLPPGALVEPQITPLHVWRHRVTRKRPRSPHLRPAANPAPLEPTPRVEPHLVGGRDQPTPPDGSRPDRPRWRERVRHLRPTTPAADRREAAAAPHERSARPDTEIHRSGVTRNDADGAREGVALVAPPPPCGAPPHLPAADPHPAVIVQIEEVGP